MPSLIFAQSRFHFREKSRRWASDTLKNQLERLAVILVDSLAKLVDLWVFHETSSDQVKVVVKKYLHVVADGVGISGADAREYAVNVTIGIAHPFIFGCLGP